MLEPFKSKPLFKMVTISMLMLFEILTKNLLNHIKTDKMRAVMNCN